MSHTRFVRILWIVCMIMAFIFFALTVYVSCASPAVPPRSVAVTPRNVAVLHAHRHHHHHRPVATKRVTRRIQPSRGLFPRRRLLMQATAYAPCTRCCGNAHGTTYTGLRAQRGIIAVDPRVIPLGSRVYVEGYGMVIAGDTGSAVHGHIIDLYFATYREAKAWGRQTVIVTVY